MVLDGRAMGDEDALPCKFCDMVFDSRKELVKHKIEKHMGERVHPCKACDKCFKSVPMLNQHRSRQHGGHVSVCEGCGKRFKTNDGEEEEEEEERRRTVLAIAKKRPGILDHMTKSPFTITDICQVKLILVFWVMLYVIFFSLFSRLPATLVLNFFL
jgi:uncharacterized C2H2 Zn-finger protein